MEIYFLKKRGLAIVDEVDNILIDEARTPSSDIKLNLKSSVKLYPRINALVKLLKEGRH